MLDMLFLNYVRNDSLISHLDSSIVVLVRERVYIEFWAVLVFFLITAVYYL
jgi:hypothetical protein